MPPTITLTRQDLYDLVWSKPMTTIAAEFGVSSVAFAKHCVKLEVPRPGRGYWQQQASGLDPKRDPLPGAGRGVPATVTITRHERVAEPVTERPPTPVVVVPDQVRKLHPVVKELDGLLRPAPVGPMFIVRGQDRSVLRVSSTAKLRALRILHALFRALDERGHHSQLRKLYSSYALELLVGGVAIELDLHEHSNRIVQQDESPQRGPRHDYVASGHLFLRVGSAHSRPQWSDSTRRLEEVLGEVVLEVEAEARRRVQAAERYAATEAVRQEEQRRREHEKRRIAHQRALTENLVTMASAWQQAQVVRAFVEAARAAVSEGQRTPEFSDWLAWATAHTASLDPLAAGMSIAKPLEPEPLEPR